jgi:hypothetical protein
MTLLDGRWRLLYSSSFRGGSLGGSRPGLPFGDSLSKLGQVRRRLAASAQGIHQTL